MEKTPGLFDQRNQQKKSIEFQKQKNQDVRIGEFRRYREGVNVGNEISKDGKFMRVCLILQNNLGNGLLLIAPITTKYHHWMSKYYIEVKQYERYGLKQCRIILNQIKLVDRKRMVGMTGVYHPHNTLAQLTINRYVKIVKKNHLKRKARGSDGTRTTKGSLLITLTPV